MINYPSDDCTINASPSLSSQIEAMKRDKEEALAHYSSVRAENDALRDALREIRKAAGSGKEFTNRMQYIHARAGYAIDGLTWTDDHKREYGYTVRDRTMAENDALRKQASEAGFDLNCVMPLVRQALRTVDEWNNDPLKPFVHPFTKYANTARAAMARYDSPTDDELEAADMIEFLSAENAAALANRPADAKPI